MAAKRGTRCGEKLVAAETDWWNPPVSTGEEKSRARALSPHVSDPFAVKRASRRAAQGRHPGTRGDITGKSGNPTPDFAQTAGFVLTKAGKEKKDSHFTRLPQIKCFPRGKNEVDWLYESFWSLQRVNPDVGSLRSPYSVPSSTR